MTEREKLALLEDMLELDEGDLTVETILDDIDEYDSMAKLSLIVLIDCRVSILPELGKIIDVRSFICF